MEFDSEKYIDKIIIFIQCISVVHNDCIHTKSVFPILTLTWIGDLKNIADTEGEFFSSDTIEWLLIVDMCL